MKDKKYEAKVSCRFNENKNDYLLSGIAGKSKQYTIWK
jgi:hypothetical protein